MGWFQVNRRLLPIKLHYALSCGMVTIQPALSVYTKILRFSTVVVGTMFTILHILGIFIKPTFATIADKFNCHRAVLIAWEVIMLTFYFGIQFIPSPDVPVKNNSTQLNGLYPLTQLSVCSGLDVQPYLLAENLNNSWKCPMTEQLCSNWNVSSYCSPYDNSTFYVSIGKMFTVFGGFVLPTTIILMDTCVPLSMENNLFINRSDCTIWPPSSNFFSTNNTNSEDNTLDDADTFRTWQFWVFLVLLIGTTGGTTVTSTLSDTICYEICGSAYGQQRMWSSLYWGIVAIINGFIIDAVSTEGEDKNYTPSFYLMLVPLLIDVYITYNLKFEIPKRSENMVKDIGKIIFTLRSMLFMLWCVMVGVSFGLLWNFLFWLLEDLATANDQMSEIKTIEGFVTGIQALLGEAPAFFLGGWVVKTVGYGHSISLVFLFIGLRFIFYSILVNPWWCLPIELFQNDLGLFYSTMTSFAKSLALPGTEATVQSVFCVACEGVGVAIGSFIGGLIYDNYGGNTAFRSFGIGFLILAAVNEVIEFALKFHDGGLQRKSYDLSKEINKNGP